MEFDEEKYQRFKEWEKNRPFEKNLLLQKNARCKESILRVLSHLEEKYKVDIQLNNNSLISEHEREEIHKYCVWIVNILHDYKIPLAFLHVSCEKTIDKVFEEYSIDYSSAKDYQKVAVFREYLRLNLLKHIPDDCECRFEFYHTVIQDRLFSIKNKFDRDGLEKLKRRRLGNDNKTS